MANKAISELPQALNVNNQDLFVLEQSGIAKKLTAETFITEQGIIDALAEALDGHGGIQSVTLSSVSGRIRTYLITFTDQSATTFQVLDGTSIDRIEKTSTAGLVDTYTIFMSDGTTSFFQVTNGSKGDPGGPTDEQVTTAVNTWLEDNVAQETGYVLDRTLSMSNAAAPADLAGDLKTAIENNIVMPPVGHAIIQGSYKRDGSVATNAARIRVDGFVQVKKGDAISFRAGTLTKEMLVGLYDTNKEYQSEKWYADGANFELEADGYVIIVFRKNSSNPNILPSEYDATTKLIPNIWVEINNLMDIGEYVGEKNLVGNVPGVFYKLQLKKGETFTVTDGTGAGFANNTELHYYDTNKTEIGYNGLGGSTARVISYAYNTPCEYAKISQPSFSRQQIMLTRGAGAVDYVPYIDKNIASSFPTTSVDITTQNNSVMDKILNAKKLLSGETITPLTLLHFSDVHGGQGNVKRIIEMKESLGQLVDDIICTGDIVTNSFTDGISWWGQISGAEKIMLCIGNHDVSDTNDYNSYSGITPSEAYNLYFAPYISNWNVTHSGSLTYYYKDYPTNKLRLIVMDYLLTGDDATAQNTWLQSVLADAKTNNYTVVIAEHTPVSGTTYIPCNFTMLGINTVYTQFLADYQSSVANFKTGGGKFACYLCGHRHADAILYNSNYPDQICISVTCTRTTGADNDQYRGYNTKSQDAANVVTIDTTTETIKLIRIGADMDNYLRPRNELTISYADKTIITQN